MDPLDFLRREHHTIQRRLSDLDDMTYSVSVNVRDLSFSFKEFLKLLGQHEEKEKLLVEILENEGIFLNLEPLNLSYGAIREKVDEILDGLEKGVESEIKEILGGICSELIDRIKAHFYVEEEAFQKIKWDELDKKTLERIALLQIIPSRKWV